MVKPRHFLIACGGTGGHLAPGIALAEQLRAAGCTATLVISRKEVDSRLMAKYPDIRHVALPSAPLLWRPVALARFFREQARGLAASFALVRREKPDVVVAFGGFSSLGPALAARMAKVPVALHEANRKVGRAVRTLCGLADRVYLPPGVSLRRVEPRRKRFFGLPVRAEIQPMSREAARARLGLPESGKWLVVLGGSQGAQSLNDWARKQSGQLAAAGINLLCVTGPGKGPGERASLPVSSGGEALAVYLPFSDDMAAVIGAADLIVTRSGAGTLAEIARCRRPAILVPFPYAADNHQAANAAYFEQRAAALVVSQENLGHLREEVEDLIFNEFLLQSFRRNLARLEEEEPAGKMVEDLLGLAAGAGVAPVRGGHVGAEVVLL